MAARIRAWLQQDRRLLARGLMIGLASLAVLVLAGDLGGGQRFQESRVAQRARGQVTPDRLARLAQSMSPLARAIAGRILSGREWTPPPPDGLTPAVFRRPPTLLQRNLSFEEARNFNALIPDLQGPSPSLKPFSLPARGPERERAELCLTQAVYYEAGFETGEGQEAVAQVILNRLRHPAYPKSVCGVVYQGSQRTTGCQFSFTCDGSLAREPSPAAWARAQFVARQALNGFVFKPVGVATHYHADYVFPYWAVTLVKLRQIGAHIFYRMTGPPGTPEGFNGRYAGGETVLTADVLQGGDAITPDAPSITVTPPLMETPPAQTVTLTIGGEARTYVVAPGAATAGLPAASSPLAGAPAGGAATGPNTVVYGTLQGRRMPTPDEMNDINEKLRLLEEKLAADRAAGKSNLPGEK